MDSRHTDIIFENRYGFKTVPHSEDFRLRVQQYGAGAIHYKLVKDIKDIENLVLKEIVQYYENVPCSKKVKLSMINEQIGQICSKLNEKQQNVGGTNLRTFRNQQNISTRAAISKDVRYAIQRYKSGKVNFCKFIIKFFATEVYKTEQHRNYSRQLLTRIFREPIPNGGIPDIPGHITGINASVNLFRYTISKPGKKKKTVLIPVSENNTPGLLPGSIRPGSARRPVSAPVLRDEMCSLTFNRVSDDDLRKLADLVVSEEEKIPRHVRENRKVKISYFVDIEDVMDCRPKTGKGERDLIVKLK